MAVPLNFGLAAIGAQPYISTLVSPATMASTALQRGSGGLTPPVWPRQPGHPGFQALLLGVRRADECRNVRPSTDSRQPEIQKASHHAFQGPPGNIGWPSATFYAAEGKPPPLLTASIGGTAIL